MGRMLFSKNASCSGVASAATRAGATENRSTANSLLMPVSSEFVVQAQLQNSGLIAAGKAGDLAEGGASLARVGIREIGVVENVQRFNASLQNVLLRNPEILQQRGVHVHRSRTFPER